PCAVEDEQPNYSGFGYLVSGLAEAGYVALSVNINAENTFGFGEPVPGERLAQLLRAHLVALETASAGGENGFGVALNGRADLSRIALAGHSRGGENAYWLTHQQEWDVFPQGNDSIAGILLVAASPATFFLETSDTPQAQVLPNCDGDVIGLDGQLFYEHNRLDESHTAWMTSVVLARANHNHFNSILRGDMAPQHSEGDRPDCDTLIEPEAQRQFLVDYAVDFLTVLFGEDADAVGQAQRNLGLDVTAVAPSELYGLPARVAFQPPADKRQTLFVPRTADEQTTNLLGGTVTAENVDTTFCPDRFYSPESMPGTEACHRVNVIVPGQPAHAVLAWSAPGAAWRLGLPEGQGDLSGYTTLSLRVVADPLTMTEPPLFSLQLTDTAGNTAVVTLSPDEPALQLPEGAVREDEFLPAGVFRGIVPLLTLHVPLADFAGVDAAQVSEVAVLFDQTPSGAIFLADVAATRP
ncbi:MAG: hypothetical protein KDD89_04750, partial [Anaerolineales bacterium]|nr:hypothetical protein [Anaerolineales bacterium]